MTTRWHPTTCDCIILVEPKKYKFRCNLHKDSRDVSEQKAHHDTFRLLHGRNPTEAQRVDIDLRSEAEKIRIRTGAVLPIFDVIEERLLIQPLTTFQKAKKIIGRLNPF